VAEEELVMRADGSVIDGPAGRVGIDDGRRGDDSGEGKSGHDDGSSARRDMPIIACIYKAQKVLGCGGDFLLFVPYSFFFIVDTKSMPGGWV
jgi:hypothetical protein